MSIKPTPLKDSTIEVYDNLYDDKIINFYNDFLNVLQANENIPDFMKSFYKESWSNIAPEDMMLNVLWFCKCDSTKKNELNNDLESYFV
jgi:hypothetical protein